MSGRYHKKKRCFAWDEAGNQCPEWGDFTGLCQPHADKAASVAIARELWPHKKKQAKPAESGRPYEPLVARVTISEATWREFERLTAPLHPETCKDCGYIYIVDLGDGIVKIGKSRNPRSRLSSFQCVSVRPVRMDYISMRVFNSRAVESQIHGELADLRHMGEEQYGPREQFRISVEDAIRVVSAACNGRLCRHPWEQDAPKTRIEAM